MADLHWMKESIYLRNTEYLPYTVYALELIQYTAQKTTTERLSHREDSNNMHRIDH